MTVYYVDGASGSDSNTGLSVAQAWKTLSKANGPTGAAVGDTVKVRTATYYERLVITKNNLTFENDTGHTPTIDGRYNPTLFGAAGYKNSAGNQVKTNELPAMRADNAALGNWVTYGNYVNMVWLQGTGSKIRGFTIRNIPGRAIAMGGDNTLVENCRIDFCYSGGINIETPKNARVNNCVLTRISVNYFNPTISTEPGIVGQGVVTAIICKGTDNVIENNLVAYCYGEGIAASKKGVRQTIRYNTAHTCNHWPMGTNASDGAMFYGNITYFCTNHYDHFKNKTNENIPDAFVAGDEVAGKQNFGAEPSVRTKIYNNLFIGGNRAFLSGGKDRPFTWTQAYFGYNTVIGSKYTKSPMVHFIFNVGQEPHANSVWENNIFLKHPLQTGAPSQYGGGNGIKFRNNFSNATLAGGMTGDNGNVVGATQHGLVNPFVEITGVYDYKSTSLPDPTNTTFNPANYDLISTSWARGRASDRSNTNGLTLPVITVDRYGYARSNMGLAGQPYYDIGSDEYGSNAPPVEDDTITASFNRTPGTGTAPLTVTFTDTSTETGTAAIDGWAWTFGDGVGTSTNQNPTYTYTTAGTYSPRLTVSDASLSLSDSFTGPSITVNPVVTGSVTARFSRTPSTGQESVTLFTFTDTSTVTGNGVINSWAWDFRDGSTSTAQNPTHTYTTAGTYRPRLTVQDTVRGYSSTFTGPETVITAAPPEDAVEALFTQSATTGQAPLSVTFTDTSLETGAASINSWAWDFGDGTESTTASPVHVYAAQGVYTPSLTVADTVLGLTDTFVGTEIHVSPEPPPETAGDVVLRQTRTALNTGDGDQTISQAALNGITPKSVRFIVTKAIADDTAADGQIFGYGAATASAQWAACVTTAHGSANTNGARMWTDGACLLIIDADGVEVLRATFVAFVADGVTINLNWAAGGTAYLVQAIFGGGTEYEAWVGTVLQGNESSIRVAVTNFQPDAVHAVATWGLDDIAASDATISLGLAHRLGGQYTIDRHYDDAQAATINDMRLFEDYILTCRYSAVKSNVRVTSWTSVGVNLQVFGAAINSTALIMAEKYGSVQSRVALVDTAIAVGSTDYTLGWEPQYVEHIVSMKEGLGASANTVKAGTLGVHTVTADGGYTMQVSGENGATTTNEQSLSSAQFIIVGHTGTTAANGSTTLGTTKYSINYESAPATALKMINLAVEKGQSDTGGGDYVTAAFAADVTSGATPLRVTFTDLSVGTNPITSWAWDFGDGQTSTEQNPVHTYASGGVYTVTLTASDGTIENTATAENYITATERTAREIIIGPYLMKAISDTSIQATYRDPADVEAGYMEAAVAFDALPLTADPAVPTVRSTDWVLYSDPVTGDWKVLFPDGTTGTVNIT